LPPDSAPSTCIKAYNRITGGEASAPPNEVVLLTGILDEMRGVRSDLASGGAGGSATPPPTA
jgi:hypothetical protein